MALETGTYVNDLVPGNPPGSDSKSEGDNHLRLIKTVLQNTFPKAYGPLKFRSDDDTANLTLEMTFFKKSATPAANDPITAINFNAQNSVLVEKTHARLLVTQIDPTSGSEDANFYIQTIIAGTLQTAISCTAAGTTVLGVLTGNGSGLTSLNATNISSGTLADARIPATVTNIDDLRLGGSSVIRFMNADSTTNNYLQGASGPAIRSVIGGVEAWRTFKDFTFWGKTIGDVTIPGVVLWSNAYGNSSRIDVTSKDHEAMFIVRVGTTAASSAGTMVIFQRGGTQVGSLSVDTNNAVALNAFLGTHWSQTVDGTQPANCYQGTIVESIGTICFWASEEVETRLPKFKISTTAASTAVIGVFWAWDTDDAFGDAFIASTGLGFVRINAGEVVNVGDLITSAGNGCGTKQTGATINTILASTVAKVVSTVKAETYPDNSFRVPAILYC